MLIFLASISGTRRHRCKTLVSREKHKKHIRQTRGLKGLLHLSLSLSRQRFSLSVPHVLLGSDRESVILFLKSFLDKKGMPDSSLTETSCRYSPTIRPTPGTTRLGSPSNAQTARRACYYHLRGGGAQAVLFPHLRYATYELSLIHI